MIAVQHDKIIGYGLALLHPAGLETILEASSCYKSKNILKVVLRL